MHPDVRHRTRQTELVKGNATAHETGDRNHFEKVMASAQEIRALRQAPRVAEHPPARVPAETVIHASYLGSPLAASAYTLDAWDNEGGALDPPEVPSQSVTTLTLSSQYFVGDRVFSDLSLAIAEHSRQKLVQKVGVPGKSGFRTKS